MRHLREGHRCDYIICLSHLGYESHNGRVNDQIIARESPGIDLIIGGHTHTFLNHPHIIQNGGGHTIVTQAGHSGLRLGRIDLTIDSDGRIEEQLPQPYLVGRE